METYLQLTFDQGPGDYANFVLDKPLYEHFGRNVPFFSGQLLKGVFPRTKISLKSKPKAPDCIGIGSLDLVSKRVRDFLVTEKVNVEFLEVEVEQIGTRVKNQYYEMNVLDVIACLDRKRSVFQESTLSSGERFVSGIDELYLYESKLQGSRLFVMDERPLLFVREDLANTLRIQKFTGLSFKPLPKGPF